MVKVIMHGCNGKMGQMITGLIAADEEIEIVAGIDAYGEIKNPYPVFRSTTECDVEADAVIDFSNSVAIDGLLEFCAAKKIPCVLCTTGLSPEQIEKVNEASEQVAILRSANMSLGINMLLKLLKEATGILAPAEFCGGGETGDFDERTQRANFPSGQRDGDAAEFEFGDAGDGIEHYGTSVVRSRGREPAEQSDVCRDGERSDGGHGHRVARVLHHGEEAEDVCDVVGRHTGLHPAEPSSDFR